MSAKFKIFRRLLWLLLLAAPFLLQRALIPASGWVESVYSTQIFPVLASPLRTLSSLLPFSLTEFVIISAPVVLAWGGFYLFRAFRKHQFKESLGKITRAVTVFLIIGVWLFKLLHGLNYLREPVATSFDFPVRQRSALDLENMAVWVIDQASTARAACDTNDQDVFQLQNSLNLTLQQGLSGYQSALSKYPLLASAGAHPKSVFLSPLWSYTGITGLYMPLWVEANINTDQPDYLLPATVEHELAHTIGFAREDEAGFIGFLAGTSSPYLDYRYSSYADALIRILNSLMASDPEAYARIVKHVPAEIWRDIEAANRYWAQFAGPVEKTSTQINNAYLKANLQTDGVHSYGRMVDLLLAWYEKNHTNSTLPEALP